MVIRKNKLSRMRTMDIHQILERLPHRYPFLLIDKVLDCEPGMSLVAVKNVTINEAFFQGHFPPRPVMPGVLILESMAQATGLLAYITLEEPPDEDSMYYLVGIDKARFKRPVEPGDQLVIDVRLMRELRGIWRFTGTARVNDQLVASCELMTAKTDNSP